MESNDRSIAIQPVHEDELDELLNLYVDLFHDREPLTKCIGFSKERMISLARAMSEEASMDAVSKGLYWMARDRGASDTSVGFIVCADAVGGSEQQVPEDLTEEETARISLLGALLEEIRKPIKQMLLGRKGEVVHVAAVGVASGYEGRGIARRLLESALSAAQRSGFHTAFSECTGTASRRLHEKCGFEALGSVSMDAFLANGQRPFAGYELEIWLMRKVLDAGG